jgi:thioredoxin 2
METTAATVVVCSRCGKKNRVRAAGPGSPRCGSCGAPLPWITDAGDDDFADIAEAADIPVLVDLWAPWCGPCRMVSPALERIANDFAGRVKLVKVNVDEARRVAQRFDAQGIPTLLLLDHGQVIARQVGAAPEAQLREWLEQGLRGRERGAEGAA